MNNVFGTWMNSAIDSKTNIPQIDEPLKYNINKIKIIKYN